MILICILGKKKFHGDPRSHLDSHFDGESDGDPRSHFDSWSNKSLMATLDHILTLSPTSDLGCQRY
jgi:hypothetical protein